MNQSVQDRIRIGSGSDQDRTRDRSKSGTAAGNWMEIEFELNETQWMNAVSVRTRNRPTFRAHALKFNR